MDTTIAIIELGMMVGVVGLLTYCGCRLMYSVGKEFFGTRKLKRVKAKN